MRFFSSSERSNDCDQSGDSCENQERTPHSQEEGWADGEWSRCYGSKLLFHSIIVVFCFSFNLCNFIGKIFYWRNFIQSDQNVPVPVPKNLTPVFDSIHQRRRRWICRRLWRASRPSRERFSSPSTTARSSTSLTAKTSMWRSLS